MNESRFVYVTYIRVSPEKLWQALTTTELMKSYFFGATFDSDWKQGSPWRMVLPGGDVSDSGEILEFSPPSRLVLSWRHEMRQERKDEGLSRLTAEIEPAGEASKLTISHGIAVANSKLIAGVSEGWPRILSNLKSMLETGKVVV